MEDSKVWLLVSSFAPAYLREASRWVKADFINRKPQVILLWHYLHHCVKHPHKEPQLTSAFDAAYPNEEFDLGKLRLVMSDLYKLLLDFIAYQEWKKETMSHALYQAKYLRRAGLEKLARQQLRTAEQERAKTPVRNADFHRHYYEVLEEQYFLDSRARPSDDEQLGQLSATADLALLSSKLRQICRALSHQSIYTSAHQPGFIEQVISHAATTGLIKEPAIGLYYHCYFMLREAQEEAHFKAFKQLLFSHHQAFPATELRELHLMGINYCIQKVNQGKEHYFEEVMDFYKKGLAGKYLLENGVLSRFTYYNIVAAALRTGQYEWAEAFIFNYRGKLSRLYRESSFSFCLARLEYARKSYDAALPLLQKANYKDPLLNLSAKTLLMKIYYEIEAYDLLHAHLDAMQNYIRRKRVIGYHKTNYLNIIRYSRKLMSINPFEKNAMQQLSKKITTEEILTERNWLLEQLGN